MLTLREISKMCDTVGAPMCAVCENLGIIKIVGEDYAAERLLGPSPKKAGA